MTLIRGSREVMRMHRKSTFHIPKRDAGSNGLAFPEALRVNGSVMIWASTSSRPANYFS